MISLLADYAAMSQPAIIASSVASTDPASVQVAPSSDTRAADAVSHIAGHADDLVDGSAAPPDKLNASDDGPRTQEIAPARREVGGRGGLEPTRFGDWEKNGRCIDF